MLSLLVGYWSGFVMLLVWVYSMSAACNASHTTGKQTRCQHHDKLSSNTPAPNLGNMVGFWFRSWFWCWYWVLEYGLCLFGNRHEVLIGSECKVCSHLTCAGHCAARAAMPCGMYHTVQPYRALLVLGSAALLASIVTETLFGCR